MLKTISTAIILAAAITMTGCSAFRNNPQSIAIDANVKDAQVFVNGESVGKTPCTTEVKADWNGAEVSIKKEKYKPYKTQLPSNLSKTGILDAVGTFFFLFPGIGLFFDGAWDLEKHTVNAELIKE